MALGDKNGKNSNKAFENQYYSRMKVRDYTHNTDKGLNFSFKSGMLVLEINKAKEGGFEFESLINIYITPTKAKILLKQIQAFKEALVSGNPLEGYGINTGMGDVQSILTLGLINGETGITIAKINSTGSITSMEQFTFNTKDFHYGLNFNSIRGMEFKKVSYNDIELEQFEDIIKNFAEHANGAVAYSVLDLGRYDLRSVLNKMNPIFDALGIERNIGGQSRGNSGGGYFNNNNGGMKGGTSTHKSYDEMEDDLPYDEE